MHPHDVTEYRERTFDVAPSDPNAARKYPVSAAFTEAVAPVAKAWLRGPVLDQGAEGACVGHGVVNELTSTPIRVKFADVDLPDGAPPYPQGMAFWTYRQAQRIDEWPGESYSGTSVNAGMRIARDLGLIDSWYWAQSREDFRASLVAKGPVVLAIPWFSGMYSAPGGVLRVTGDLVGWHCILANAYDPRRALNNLPRTECVRLLNSWGTDWGSYGSAWMNLDELWNLIDSHDAEMVVPVGRSLT